MKKSDVVVAVALGLAIVIAVTFFRSREAEPPVLDLPPEADTPPATVEAPEPAIRYPVPASPPTVEPPAAEPEIAEPTASEPEAPEGQGTEQAEQVEQTQPLPTLDDSDDAVKQALYTLAARSALDSLFNFDRIIRRFVVTVDNLPRKHLLNSKYRSNRAVRGQPIVAKDSQGLYLSEKNYTRYAPFMTLLESVDSDRLVLFYLDYYPLIQAAYEDLGYPSAYFNDRLIDVIDHLLEAPDVSGRISLLRPHVLYKYADPTLEALSAGQKVLIRIGPKNAATVKSKLRQLRQALTGENTKKEVDS